MARSFGGSESMPRLDQAPRDERFARQAVQQPHIPFQMGKDQAGARLIMVADPVGDQLVDRLRLEFGGDQPVMGR